MALFFGVPHLVKSCVTILLLVNFSQSVLFFKPVYPYGIYLDAANAYVVQSNTITNALATTFVTDYGIIGSFTGTNPNELKQNNFTIFRLAYRLKIITMG